MRGSSLDTESSMRGSSLDTEKSMWGSSLNKMSGGSNTIEKTGRNKRESHIPTRRKAGDMALS